MDKKILFASGMFRSGTTLLARMLNNHDEICLASDPLRPMFNSFRHEILRKEIDNESHRFLPFSDYFLRSEDLNSIMKSNLEIEIGGDKRKLWSIVKESANPYSDLWSEKIDIEVAHTTYKEAINYAIEMIDQVYSKNNKEKYIGFKEVWATEMCSPILKSITDSKCIIIIRDPRAVVASKNSTIDPYPVFFMARQWRKICYIASKIGNLYPDKVLIIQYENLISNPDSESKRIIDFLHIEDHRPLIDVKGFTDGKGGSWEQNSSYDYQDKTKFQTRSIDQWRHKLSQSDINLIELICYDWMKLFGYKPSNTIEEILSLSSESFTRIKDEFLAEWIRPYSFDDDRNEFEKQISIEKSRLGLSGLSSYLNISDKVQFQYGCF